MESNSKSNRLAAIKGRATKWEIVAKVASHGSYCVSYSARKTKGGLLLGVRGFGETLADMAGITEDSGARYSKGSWTFDNGALILSWGRTQRQAIIEGELPPVPVKQGRQFILPSPMRKS